MIRRVPNGETSSASGRYEASHQCNTHCRKQASQVDLCTSVHTSLWYDSTAKVDVPRWTVQTAASRDTWSLAGGVGCGCKTTILTLTVIPQPNPNIEAHRRCPGRHRHTAACVRRRWRAGTRPQGPVAAGTGRLYITAWCMVGVSAQHGRPLRVRCQPVMSGDPDATAQTTPIRQCRAWHMWVSGKHKRAFQCSRTAPARWWPRTAEG